MLTVLITPLIMLTVTTSRKAWFHQKGGFSPWKRYVPARPFMGIGEDDVTAVDELAQKIMDKAVRKANAS